MLRWGSPGFGGLVAKAYLRVEAGLWIVGFMMNRIRGYIRRQRLPGGLMLGALDFEKQALESISTRP